MLFFKDEEDFRKGLKENIEYNVERINSIEERIKTQAEWLKRTSDADTLKSIRSGITKSKGIIAKHREFIAHSQQRYAKRYGQAELTVIRGGKA